jgi:hypothetical protein
MTGWSLMSECSVPNKISAGDFSQWLDATLNGLHSGTGVDVPCGDCRACCTSSYFIHIDPDENAARAAAGDDAIAAPGRPGVQVMGFDDDGLCPKMKPAGCSIYHDRPRTCRIYDCRLFAAAGLDAGPRKPRINERVNRWKFTYQDDASRAKHSAVTLAAAFIVKHAPLFPGGRIPADPGQLALLALKVHEIFLPHDDVPSNSEIVNRIVERVRRG